MAGTGGRAGAAGAAAGAGGGLGGAAGSLAGAAGGAAGAPSSFYKPAKFSANFDDGAVGQKPAAPFTAGGNATIDTTQKYSGTKSVKVTCGGDGGGDQCMFSLPLNPQWLGPKQKTVYTRFMVYMSAYPSTDGREHWDVMKLFGDFKSDDSKKSISNGFLSVGGFAASTMKFMIFGTDPGGVPAEDCSKNSKQQIKPKEWACVELRVDEEAPLNYGVSVNDTEIQNFSFPYLNAASNCANFPPYIADIFNGVWYIPVAKRLAFGFNSVSNGAPVSPPTVWIDDVAVSDAPIGCPAVPK